MLRAVRFLVVLMIFTVWCRPSRSEEIAPDSSLHGKNGGEAQAEKLAAEAEKLHGPIFVDWQRPQVTLLFTGELNGYFEPCGCAGLENQLGGLKRRHTLFKQLRQQGWPLVAFDLGGQVRRFGPQANIKFRYTLESLMKMGYSGIGLGACDLQLDTDAVLYVLANINPENNPLVSANVALFGFESHLSTRYRVIEAGGLRIGATSVLGTRYQADVAKISDVTWVDPVEALDDVAPEMAGEGCDWQVLMVHGDPDEAAELGRRYSQFQLVATTGGAEEPPNRAQIIEGTETRLIEVGHKGMYAVAIGLYRESQKSMRYQRVPLDIRFAESPEMQEVLVAYQNELETLGLEGLGLTGVNNPKGQFVGSAVCANCHSSATEVFEETSHAHAMQTLLDLDPPRHHDPECIGCHVVGWDPQRFFPYKSGYFGLEETPHLRGAGCEDCHGPGGAHVAVESGEETVEDDQRMQLREAMRLSREAAEGEKIGAAEKKCLECHDLDNSPAFDFEEYWPQVEHHGKY